MFKRGLTTLLTLALSAGVLCGSGLDPAHAGPEAANSPAAHAVTNGPIAYTKDWPGRIDIFTVRPDGSHNLRLTFFRDASRPKFSPTGGQIAFQRPDDVWVMDEDGSDQRRLTDGTLVDWMPTGDRVLVARGLGVDGEDPTWVLHTISTGEEEELVIDLPLVADLDEDYEDYSEWSSAGSPVLSPDGKTLALMLYRVDYGDDGYSWDFASVFTVDLDGTGLTRVPKYTYSWGISAWSPNGQQLLYWASEPRGYCASSVRSLRLDGTAGAVYIPRRCAEPNPTWSPDGRKILFISGRSDSLQIASKDGKRNRNVIPQADGVYRTDPDWRAGS